ncbi:MAG: hypothetical protein ACTHMC_01530 [Pseudobacter sp.]|uniref:hypothetical protein n=1 Tax=Pseudobacter sp. TaxID=2045420 RepID=UPI003F80E501
MPEALEIQDTTYAGEAASFMLTRAVVGADTIQKGCIMVEDGIKKKKTIPRLDVTNIMQKRQATPTSSGSMVVDARALEPEDSMAYLEFNPRDFEQHWFAVQMNPKLLDAELPPTAENFVMLMMMERLNEFFENGIWRSRKDYDPDGAGVDPTSKGAEAADAAYLYWDGLIIKALEDPNTIAVSSPVALTGGASGNIITEFQRAYQKVPKALIGKYGELGLKLFISIPDQQKYENTMQLQTTFKNQDTTERGINRYNGYDVVPLAGLPENTFFWGMGKPDTTSNLWMGINSQDDNELKMQQLQNNSEYWFIKGLFKTDVQIGWTEELVMYTTQVA